MWFAGLRGAIAFALSREDDSEISKAMYTTTLMIVFFTVILEGGVTIPLLEKLKIPMNQDYDSILAHQESNQFSNKFILLDLKYLKPFFTKNQYRPLQTADSMELEDI